MEKLWTMYSTKYYSNEKVVPFLEYENSQSTGPTNELRIIVKKAIVMDLNHHQMWFSTYC